MSDRTVGPEPQFTDPEDFMLRYLAPLMRRRLGGSYTWCPQWWKHSEAILRISAMWETWEQLRHEGALGVSTWLLHHADPHMAVLLSKDNGPFSACRPDRHTQLAPLPSDPAPPGIWDAAGSGESR